jgi:hypothetical protein
MPIANYAVASSLVHQSLPTHHTYHMMAESRPLYLLFRLFRTPLRLQRRYHADPLLKYAAFVVYIHMPIANYAVASSLVHQSLPTHHTYHMMAESRPLYLLFRLFRTPLRLQRRYHADPLLKYAAFVVYIHMPIANYAVASSLVHQSLPTHHTYHMMAESRPLYLLFRLFRTPLRLQRRYHADPLLKYAAFVVRIHMPIANYAVASSLVHQSLPTHHTI